MVRVSLPYHLRALAGVAGEVALSVPEPATLSATWDALEASYPMLRGTFRDQATGRRRPFVRWFACQEDLSHQPPDEPLPSAVLAGAEVLHLVGAMAGG
jgi:hypothetical protein